MRCWFHARDFVLRQDIFCTRSHRYGHNSNFTNPDLSGSPLGKLSQSNQNKKTACKSKSYFYLFLDVTINQLRYAYIFNG